MTSYQPTKAFNPSAGDGYELPTYAFELPPELIAAEGSTDVKSTLRYPVVIVGAGLAGLTAACDFALRGIKAIVIDEDNTVGVKGASSRGICYAQKSLEIFHRLGIFERIKAKGIEWSVGKTLAGDDVVYEFDLTSQASHNLSVQPAFINLQQFYLEWFLVDRIQELQVSELRWQSRVVGVEQHADHVSLQIETPAGSYAIQADWLLDASGLRSPIREASGLKVEQSMGVDRWCISDVRFKDKKPIERWTWIEAPFNDDRAVWQHLMADDVWRLDYQMEPEADPAHVSSPAVVADRLKRHLGDDVEFDLVWVGPYSYRSHLLENFQFRRTFFLGDCAHVMSPFGARGGNSAIQDADNLVWKLARVIAGQSGPEILSSYNAERRQGAQTNIQITNRTARFLSPRSPAEKMIRNAVIDLAKQYAFARFFVNTGRLSTANTYTDSALSISGASVSIQNFPLQLYGGTLKANRKIDNLVEFIAACGYKPLLIVADGITTPSVFESINAAQIEADFGCTPAVLFAADQPNLPGGWHGVKVTPFVFERLVADFGLSKADCLAVLRPDLHSAGACGLDDFRQTLQSTFKLPFEKLAA